jgi:hypothetical protein
VSALSRIDQLDRRLVARVAWQRFAARRMARDYLRLYARSIVRDLTVPALSALPVQAAAAPALEAASLASPSYAGHGE